MANNGIRMLPMAQNGRLLELLTLDDLARESLACAATVLVKTTKERPTDAR